MCLHKMMLQGGGWLQKGQYKWRVRKIRVRQIKFSKEFKRITFMLNVSST